MVEAFRLEPNEVFLSACENSIREKRWEDIEKMLQNLVGWKKGGSFKREYFKKFGIEVNINYDIIVSYFLFGIFYISLRRILLQIFAFIVCKIR